MVEVGFCDELIQYERHFSSMLADLSLACVMLNGEWRVLFINNFMLEVTGWTREEVLNQKWVDIFVPISQREKVSNTQMLISEGLIEIVNYEEKEILTRNGDILSFEWNNSVIKNSTGKFLGSSSLGKPLEFNPVICLGEAHKIPLSSKEKEIALESKKQIGDYILIKALGGESGHVQLGIHRLTNQKVAVKSLRKNQMTSEELERARREIHIMEKLTHFSNPYIIRLLEWNETSTHFNMIVEYVAGGELVGLIRDSGSLSESHARKLFKQMVCALECCHQHQIVHRDLKLQNILVDDAGNIKLIDFGLSNFIEKGIFRNTFCGTPAFAPPEILLGTQYKGPEVDMWSLGVVLYSMISGVFPFKSIGEILKGKYKTPENVSMECVDLLTKLLIVKKEDRIRLETVVVHPWMSFEDEGQLKVGSSNSVQEPCMKRRKSC